MLGPSIMTIRCSRFDDRKPGASGKVVMRCSPIVYGGLCAVLRSSTGAILTVAVGKRSSGANSSVQMRGSQHYQHRSRIPPLGIQMSGPSHWPEVNAAPALNQYDAAERAFVRDDIEQDASPPKMPAYPGLAAPPDCSKSAEVSLGTGAHQPLPHHSPST